MFSFVVSIGLSIYCRKPVIFYIPYPEDFWLRKTIRNASHYSCICSANLPKTSFVSLSCKAIHSDKSFLCSFFSAFLHRKEVIQPHLPIRLPCYDFTPVTGFTFDGSFPKVRSPASGASNSHGVTGGVVQRPGNVFTATF